MGFLGLNGIKFKIRLVVSRTAVVEDLAIVAAS
jgi:hypothetical protein